MIIRDRRWEGTRVRGCEKEEGARLRAKERRMA